MGAIFANKSKAEELVLGEMVSPEELASAKTELDETPCDIATRERARKDML